MAHHETHPIFDVYPYPMHRADALVLHNELRSEYRTVGDIEKIFRKCSPDWNRVVIDKLPPADVWMKALDVLAELHLLELLCTFVKQQTEKNERMEALKKAIQAVEKAQHTTRTKKIFSDHRLVLDRKLLRKNLEELLSSRTDARRVLLVRGEKGSGKTWCRWLFEQMAEDAQAAVCYFDKSTAPTIKDLLYELFTVFDVDVEIQTDEQGLLRNVTILEGTPRKLPVETTPSAWYSSLCRELKKLAVDSKKPLWIAMDDLSNDEDTETLSEDPIRSFFDQFVLSMNNPATGRWFRLMLISYPAGRPARWKDISYLEEQTRSVDVQFDDVVECIQEWALNRNRTLLDEDAIKYATDLIQTASPESRLKHIHEGLVTIFETLKAQPA